MANIIEIDEIVQEEIVDQEGKKVSWKESQYLHIGSGRQAKRKGPKRKVWEK